jgi:S-adenosylmethionine:tRNA ribosyltransferase-isomerase
MKLTEIKFSVPKNSVAKFPAEPRDSAKMMILDKKTGEITDKKFKNIIDLFEKGDCLVLNNTRVFPAKLMGKKEKTNAKIEVMLLRELKARKNRPDAYSRIHQARTKRR